MKICPNCGSKMDLDVNFCTKCGTDIRNVKPMGTASQNNTKDEPITLESANKKTDSVNNTPQWGANTNSTPAKTEQPSHAESVSQDPAPISPAASAIHRTVKKPDVNTDQSKVTSKREDYQKSFANDNVAKPEKLNFGQWLVYSWAHPMGDNKGDNFYGIWSLIIDDVLLFIGLFVAAGKATSNATMGLLSMADIPNSGQMMFFAVIALLILQWLVIFASMIGHQFVFSHTGGVGEYTTRIAQATNLNIIFLALFMILSIAQSQYATIFFIIALIVFFVGASVLVSIPDGNGEVAKRDRFYGTLIAIVLAIVFIMIFVGLIYNGIMSQINSSLGGNF